MFIDEKIRWHPAVVSGETIVSQTLYLAVLVKICDMEIKHEKKRRVITYCCVPQYNNYLEQNISFHKFLMDVVLRKKKWVMTLRIGKAVSNSMRVCGFVLKVKTSSLVVRYFPYHKQLFS